MITDVSVCEKDIFHGKIVSKVGVISWEFSDSQRCCENFGVEVTKPFTWLLDKEFVTVKLDHTDYEQYAILSIVVEDTETVSERVEPSYSVYNVKFYNYHNGYYCHNLDVYIDGVLKWNVTL